MISAPLRFALLAAFVAILVAAAGVLLSSEDAQAPENLGDAPTPTPTVSPLPPLEVERVPVRWVEVPDVLDFDSAVELEDPFKGYFSDKAPVWSVSVVSGDDAPREVLRTGRWVQEMTWDRDGLKVRAQTQREVPSTLGTVTALWRLTMTIDPANASTTDVYDPLPVYGCTQCERRGPLGSAGSGVSLSPSPDGDRMLVYVYYSQGIQNLSLPPFLLRELYVVDVDGRSRRIDGLPTGGDPNLPDLGGLDWFPTGDVLQGRSSTLAGAIVDRYVIPLESGVAAVFRETLGWAHRNYDDNRPMVDDPRAVFAYYDPNGSQGPGNYLGVYNTETGEAWQLGQAPPASQLGSSQPPTIAFFWPEASERVLAGMEPGSVLIDPGTGERRPGSFADIEPSGPFEYPSLDNRYAAYFEDRAPIEDREPDCPGLPYRLSLRDERTGRTRTLLECDTDTRGRLTWWGNDRLLVRAYDCSSCGHPNSTLLIVDVDDGDYVRVTDEPRPNLEAYGSPDGKRVAVTDRASLRLFDDAGKLLRDYGPPPEGMLYLDVIWSPDSRSFAYVLAPEEFSPGI